MAINHHPGSHFSSKQVIDRSLKGFSFYIPERRVDCGDGRHGDWAASPIRASIEILPNIFRLKGIAPYERRNNVIGEVTGDRKLTTIKSSVTQTINAVIGVNLECHEVAA